MMSEDDRDPGVEVILGYAFATSMGTIYDEGAFSRVAPYIDAIRSRWMVNGDPMGVVHCLTSASSANVELLQTFAQVDMTLEVNGPSTEMLLERDVLRALIGQVNLLVEANATRLLEVLVGDNNAVTEDLAMVEEMLARAVEYPSNWYISALSKREYYEAPLRSLSDKMKVTIKGTK